MVGGIIGLFSISRLMLSLLHRYANPTIALLTGLMLGSLSKTWPWKTHFLYAPAGGIHNFLVEQNILPTQFQLLYKQYLHILQDFLCIFLGCLVVVLLKKIGKRAGR